MKLPALCFLLILAPASLTAAEKTIPIPSGPTLLKSLHAQHPRLLARAEDFARLKQQVQTNVVLRRWYGQVRQRADQLLDAEPSRYEIPDGLRLLATSRRVLSRVYDLAMVYRLSDDRRFAERAWLELKTAGEFKDWNPRHFLDTAEMTHAFAIGYDWLYDFLTPDQRSFLRRAMVDKGLQLAVEIHRKHSSWSQVSHNWNQVCNGGIGMGALAIADEEPQLAGEFLHDALASIQNPMTHFGPDGAWDEGPGYWNYATIYNVTFLAGLESALGTDFGLSGIPGFSDAGLFPIYMNSPAGKVFNFADADERPQKEMPQLFWLGRKFKRPELAAYAESIAGAGAQDLIWYWPASKTSLARLPLDKYFRGAEVVTFRGDWSEPGAIFVGFKAGSNRANHGHLDLGSFVFDALGERWAVDLGHDDYNLPGYFGGSRFNYYRLRAEGHNTLVLNSGTGPDQDPKADTRIIRFESKPERAFAVADLTAAYSNANRVWRGVAVLNRSDLLIQDEIQSKRPVDSLWFMHSAATIMVNGARATLRQNGKEMFAQILSPPGASFAVSPAEPLATSPHPPHQASNQGVSTLAVHLPDSTTVRLAILLSTKPDSQSRVSPLSQW